MNYYIHQTPGRIRIRTPELKSCPERAGQAEAILGQLPGIQTININTVTGSVVVNFDATKLYASEIINTLARHEFLHGIIGFPKQLPIVVGQNTKQPMPYSQAPAELPPIVNDLVNTLAKLLVGAVVEKTMGKTARTIVNAIL